MLRSLVFVFIGTLVIGTIVIGTFLSQKRTQEPPSLDELMKAYFDAADEEVRAETIDRLCASGATGRDVEKLLRAGRAYAKDVPTGWQALEIECLDGKRRPYHVYAPPDYDPGKKYPLVVFLHGGVSRANVPSPQEMERLRKDFEKDVPPGFLIILPTGAKGATWWDNIGTSNILAQVDSVKRRYNVDEERVFLWGFSDGGTGAYWMAMSRPTPWAGFIAYSANVAAADLGPYQVYPRNLMNRQLLAANGGREASLAYNARFAEQWVEQMRGAGAGIDWKGFPQAGHDPKYLAEDRPRFDKFISSTKRAAKRAHIVWETTNVDVGRCDWLRIDEIKDVGNSHDMKEVNLLSFDGPPIPVDLLTNVDPKSKGPGLRVLKVVSDGPTAKAGIEPNDVIVKIEGLELKSLQDLDSIFIDKVFPKKFGDPISGELRRGDEIRKFTIMSEKTSRQPVLKRKLLSGAAEARVQGNRIDVMVRNVARYTILIDREQFDLSKPIQVVTNGKESFQGIVEPDVRFLLTQFGADNDRSTVYCACIEVTVPPGRE
ncbi:MAG: PDZ domain-containing protein [Gemmataceae bacterium]|nr:PDZ domain-containing protein [Gemmataceae bacterium]